MNLFLYFKSGSMGTSWSQVESKGATSSLTRAVESCLGIVTESNYSDFDGGESPQRKVNISRLRRLLSTAKKAGITLEVVTYHHWGNNPLEWEVSPLN